MFLSVVTAAHTLSVMGGNPTPRGMSMGNADPGEIFPPEGGTTFGRIPIGFPYYPAYHGFHPGRHPCLPPFGMGWGYPMTGQALQSSAKDDMAQRKKYRPDQSSCHHLEVDARG